MTEAKWLACSEPSLMLQQLQAKVSQRKFRLYACACWRNIWEHLTGSDREIVKVTERHADGVATLDQLLQGWTEDAGRLTSPFVDSVWDAEHAAAEAREIVGNAACRTAESEFEERRLWKRAMHQEALEQCRFLRCLFGNPFRPAQVPDEWRTWNDGALVKMARAIYDGRRWSEMPILADALEDAGCTDVILLDHCRTPAEHARGCHVLDALLGRN